MIHLFRWDELDERWLIFRGYYSVNVRKPFMNVLLSVVVSWGKGRGLI